MLKVFIMFIFNFSAFLFPVTLSVQNTTGTCGQKNVAVYINIDNAAGLLAFQFDLYFDKTKLDFISANNTPLTSNFQVLYNDKGDYVKIAAASGIPVSSGSGAICVLYFDVIAIEDGSSPLDLTASLVNDIPPTEIDGTFTILDCCKEPSGMPNNITQDLDPCSDSGVQISWSPPQNWGDNGIGIRYFKVLRDGIDISGNLSSSTFYFVDTTGINGMNYLYQVKAINGCGKYFLTNGSLASDDIFPVPSCASNPFPEDGAENLETSLTLSWSKVSDATFYEIYFGTQENPPYITKTTNNFYQVKNLEPNKTYFWKIVPGNECSKASGCGVWRFKTGEKIPEYTSSYILPACAHSKGGYGSFWKTDLSICNFSNSTQYLKIDLLKAGEDNSSPLNFSFSIEGNRCMGYEDIFWEKFQYEGSGALKISSTSDKILIESRTYNDNPKGTYGQFIPSFKKDQILKTGEIGFLTFLKRDQNFRTNIGFSSLSENSIEIKLEIFSPEGIKIGEKMVNLLPFGFIQLNDVLSEFSQNLNYGFAIVSSSTSNAYFTSYASVVDNQSNDPIFVSVKK